MLEKRTLNKAFRLLLFFFSVSIYGCNNFDNSNKTSSYTTTVTTTTIKKDLPLVVATTSVLCDLTKQIAGKTISLNCLSSPSINPKVYQPTPADQEAINQAKLIIFNGYNLEPELEKFILSSKNKAPKLPVAKIAVPSPLMITRNGKKVADPYVWHNAQNATKMALCTGLGINSDSWTAHIYTLGIPGCPHTLGHEGLQFDQAAGQGVSAV